MIPILYESTETQFTSNGLGRLVDTISATVTEERNGVYELEFQYPTEGEKYRLLREGRIVAVTHDETGDVQPFILYKRTATMDGLVTFNAYHLSYRLSNIVVMPFTASGITEAMADIVPNSANLNPFTFWTDKVVSSQFSLDEPRSVRSLLGGEQGSLLDVFGKGDYEWDKWTVKLHLNRGTDSGVSIRYGKNLSDITQDIDASNYYNAIVPYWKGEDSIVTLPEKYVTNSDDDIVAISVDLSDAFEEEPTVEQLRTEAERRIENGVNVEENIKVDFVQLWQTEEYKEFAPLQRVNLCDTVSVFYEDLGVNALQKKVIRTVWNVLLDRYDEIELGDSQTTLADIITEITDNALADVPSTSMMAQAIANATNKITGNSGGYVILHKDANGQPYELLVMDTPNINTAVNVWRWNLGGLGFSSTGYNGDFSSVALTMDGQINADLITVGTLSANRIKGGVLQLGGEDNGNGVLQLRTADGTLVGQMDNGGLKMFGQDGFVLMNYAEGFAGFDLNGNKLYWVASDQFHMKKAVVEEEITLCQKLRFIEVNTSTNTGVALVSVGG